MKTAKTESKVKSKNKKLFKRVAALLFVVVILFVTVHFALEYFSGVVCENLTSIAQSEEYAKKGNEKIEIADYYDSFENVLNDSVTLSQYAYDAQESGTKWETDLEKCGYSNIEHYDNNVSNLYKYLSKKDKNSAAMFSAVNATVATKELEDGQTLIAVAFKGTDPSDISDDFSDIYKAVDKNGFHKGFMFNAKQFDKKAKSISFSLDGKTVKLSDILDEMKNGDSKYKMLVTGHSLGAAVADIYAGYILKNKGIDPDNVTAVTYGAPKSCSDDYEYDSLNIINIINTDDLVPTIGAENHIGTCLYFTPSEDFRKSIYKDKYVEPNEYNTYCDLISSIKTGLIAHKLKTTYSAIEKEIVSNPETYIKNYN